MLGGKREEPVEHGVEIRYHPGDAAQNPAAFRHEVGERLAKRGADLVRRHQRDPLHRSARPRRRAARRTAAR
jgi:hypothetical protein